MIWSNKEFTLPTTSKCGCLPSFLPASSRQPHPNEKCRHNSFFPLPFSLFCSLPHLNPVHPEPESFLQRAMTWGALWGSFTDKLWCLRPGSRAQDLWADDNRWPPIAHPSLYSHSLPCNFVVTCLWVGCVTCFHQQNELEVTERQSPAYVLIKGPPPISTCTFVAMRPG